ncbi:hypothetical protein BLX87_11825 [Bacillus sp. VT-16-64]|nr:hypothetical protein BLX87_11825 [Bacillus sp. VT-16-64]
MERKVKKDFIKVISGFVAGVILVLIIPFFFKIFSEALFQNRALFLNNKGGKRSNFFIPHVRCQYTTSRPE